MEILQRENFLEQQVKPKSCGYIAILYTLKKKKKKSAHHGISRQAVAAAVFFPQRGL